MQGRIPNDASWCWKGIMQTRNLLSKGLCFSVRNGRSINIWEDPWIPNPHNFRPRPRNEGQRPESPTLVADLINQDSRTWKEDLVRNLFDPPSAQAILNMHIPQREEQDVAIWTPDSKGRFSVKTAYHYHADQAHRFNIQSPLSKKEWNILWNAKLQDRLKLLVWRIAWEALPVRSRVSAFMRQTDDYATLCPLCQGEMERMVHIFLSCPLIGSGMGQGVMTIIHFLPCTGSSFRARIPFLASLLVGLLSE